MSYITEFIIQIEGGSDGDLLNIYGHKLAKSEESLHDLFDMPQIFSGRCIWGSEKWYDCHEDMLALSITFPDPVFHVTGSGEDSSDRWIAHYQNGKTYSERLVFPPFNPNRLKKESEPCKK
jgi:hypothetical protein